MIPWRKGWDQCKRVVKELCDRPDHLQRWAIIGAGLVLFPLLLGFVWLVRYSFGDQPTLYSQQLGILGYALYGLLALFGLVIVALLGVVRGISAVLPNGTSLTVDLADEGDRRGHNRFPGRPNDPTC